MLKKLANSQQKHMKKHHDKVKEKSVEAVEKESSAMLKQYSEKINNLLIDGEKVISAYGLIVDFAFLTDRRLVFVDGELMNKKKKVISIFYDRIQEVAFDYGFILGEIYIFTMHNTYTIKMFNKNRAQLFTKEIMERM